MFTCGALTQSSSGRSHLTDTETHQQNQDSQREIRHQRHKNQQNVRGKVRDNHGVDEAETRSKARRQECRDSGKNIRPKENDAECRWVYTETQVEPISSEALHHEASSKGIK